MCEFKYCQGTGKCFLSATSPCAGFEAQNDNTRQQSRPRSVRMSYPGFLDHQELLDVLEAAPQADSGRMGGIVGAAPRFLRRAHAAFQGDKSKVA